jgi:hypothetical protein
VAEVCYRLIIGRFPKGPFMDEQERDAIKRRADESQKQLDTVRSLLPKNTATSLRADFARCAIDLACEHHSAVIQLVRAGEYGSAGALLRPLLEASITASCLLYAVTCDYIRSLHTSVTAGRAPDIPQLERMLDHLHPGASGWVGSWEIYQLPWHHRKLPVHMGAFRHRHIS